MVAAAGGAESPDEPAHLEHFHGEKRFACSR